MADKGTRRLNLVLRQICFRRGIVIQQRSLAKHSSSKLGHPNFSFSGRNRCGNNDLIKSERDAHSSCPSCRKCHGRNHCSSRSEQGIGGIKIHSSCHVTRKNDMTQEQQQRQWQRLIQSTQCIRKRNSGSSHRLVSRTNVVARALSAHKQQRHIWNICGGNNESRSQSGNRMHLRKEQLCSPPPWDVSAAR